MVCLTYSSKLKDPAGREQLLKFASVMCSWHTLSCSSERCREWDLLAIPSNDFAKFCLWQIFRCRLGTGSSKHIQTCHLQEQEVLALLMPNQQLDESTGLESTACHSPSVKHPQKPYFSRGLTNIRDHIMGVFLI